MKRTSVISTVFIALLFLLSGCAVDKSSGKVDKISEETIQKVSAESKTYKSINEYSKEIAGQHLKTSVLQISQKDTSADLKLEISISEHLREKMGDTEKPIYFTFGDVLGSHKIGSLLVESPPVIQIDLSKGNTYTLSQQLKLKEKLSEEEKKTLLSPMNYELQVLNEEKLAVAVFIGLETPTIQ
ncbi:hypothetical protein EEL32_04115 [Brevibacillus laterosporus]|uniref:Uncharacterized protein n=1 Tax=Brevibacillus laterosporus TaxID=1465 RepID=A0A502HV86_BRELA|nr:hypothetical protein [Brevibacillus laterosporus]QDX91325.1 hypothetical protein EEL30_02380 [Brevibacillus laterosporus]RAP17624.1 hypothetical protein C2W64_04582 [Brevibacillus laterosporus]TPG77098.1 hypothetical protein EEL32_23105 [Brevibacillus laterosporus]TPG88396.1 hypothetical protein EEL32_09595 [Brevibacillus laterosporus]TPG90147.1 hypothetical protein EEL32_04115 [Brevibacillus laterosporus]